MSNLETKHGDSGAMKCVLCSKNSTLSCPLCNIPNYCGKDWEHHRDLCLWTRSKEATEDFQYYRNTMLFAAKRYNHKNDINKYQEEIFCGMCGKKATFKCPTCHIPYYCEKTCQEKHSKEGHESVCSPQTGEEANNQELICHRLKF